MTGNVTAIEKVAGLVKRVSQTGSFTRWDSERVVRCTLVVHLVLLTADRHRLGVFGLEMGRADNKLVRQYPGVRHLKADDFPGLHGLNLPGNLEELTLRC